MKLANTLDLKSSGHIDLMSSSLIPATSMNQLYSTNCLSYLNKTNNTWDTIFADPPDNIGLRYKTYQDTIPEDEYIYLLEQWLLSFLKHSKCVWFSYNVKWWAHIGSICLGLKDLYGGTVKVKPCVQTYTFGQYNKKDFGLNHRPLLRITRSGAQLHPEAVKIKSQRQIIRDKRADPNGKVPGDVFDFPRVVGNAEERRVWHPTQLNEGLVTRCILMSTLINGSVLDPFGGTGTTLRVCKRLQRDCTLLEIDPYYCSKIATEHNLTQNKTGERLNDTKSKTLGYTST